MRHANHPWQTVGLLVGSLCLGGFSITPAMAASITYVFTGAVPGIDSALIASLPSSASPPLSRASGLTHKLTAQLVVAKRHTTNLGSPAQISVGSYQVLFPFRAGNQRTNISAPDFSKATHLSSAHDILTLIPSSSVTSWLSQSFSRTLEEPRSIFRTAALPEPSELPPSIGAVSYPRQLRLLFTMEAAPPSPVTIAQGTIAPATTVPLPASLIIAGVGLVALIGLGAGGLRHN